MARRFLCNHIRSCCWKKHYSTIEESRMIGDSVRLSYASYENTKVNEESKKPPIFIMHGMFGSRSNWHSLAKRFSSGGRKVVSIDARNHGESPHTSEMDYFLMSKDILNLMDEMGHEKVSLLGHSMGGKVSMCTALTHADRVDSLIVVDVSPISSPRLKSKTLPDYLQQMLKIQCKLLDLRIEDTTLSTARLIANDLLKEVEKDPHIRQFLATNLIDKDGRFKWRVNLDSIINNYLSLCKFPEFDTQYKGPTLFVGGSKSDYIKPTCLPGIERLFPSSEVQYIQDAGHWVHADKPSDFIKTVQQFYNHIYDQKVS